MAVKRRGGLDIPRMNDVQLLAHLLEMGGLDTTAAREQSHALLNDYGDLEHVLAQRRDKLLDYPGLGESTAAFLLLLPALMDRYLNPAVPPTVSLDDRDHLAQLLEPHFYARHSERVCALLVGEELRLITAVTVAQGGRSAVSCSTRRVLELALNHRAHGVILAHNHPDGVAVFSKSDLLSTGILLQELKLVGVSLLDHYLLAGPHLLSMRQYVHYLRDMNILLPYFLDWFPLSE